MTKRRKKAVIDLTGEALAFEHDGRRAQLIAFDPNTMTLRLNFYEGETMVGSDPAFPFAHLPKALKRLIKPN